jgi:RNA polymerase sigma-70 factor (ECF subfamily)
MDRSPVSEKEFMALWTANARAIFAYILTLEPRWVNAEDILQETSITLWEKQHEFTLNSNFRAWACKIAHFKLLESIRRTRPITVSDEMILDTLAATVENRSEIHEARFEALSLCMEKLSPRDQQLLVMRYSEEGAVKTMAARLGLNAIALYRSLRRVHENLYECIQRTLSKEGHP